MMQNEEDVGVIMPARKDHIAVQDQRRARVASLYLRCLPKSRIADILGIGRMTVDRDVKAREAMWHKEMVDDPVALKAQELAELREMEREAVRHFNDREWAALRLRYKERRAKLLGLDAPAKVAPTNPADDMPATFTLRFDRPSGDIGK